MISPEREKVSLQKVRRGKEGEGGRGEGVEGREQWIDAGRD